MRFEYDFSGYVTKNDLRCLDGKTIRHGAFKDQNGMIVPLVWNHAHDDPSKVLGRILLEDRDDGVYGYASVNDTRNGQHAKSMVMHGDVDSFSIWANQLTLNGEDVMHGTIREVSLVLAGANPGAHIDNIIAHSNEAVDGMLIWSGEDLVIEHGVFEEKENNMETENEKVLAHADEEEKKEPESEKTVGEVYESLTEEQKTAVNIIIGLAIEEAKKEGDNSEMKHNVFDSAANDEYIAHAAEVQKNVDAALKDGKKYGSLKEAFIAHGIDNVNYIAHTNELPQYLQDANTMVDAEGNPYGIANIDYLFPDARAISNTPDFIRREDAWVRVVMNGMHRTPFSRIKSIHADITKDEARARGYVKGNRKVEEVFPLLRRTTTPTTIYKKQKLDRDDVIDITDLDVVAYMKGEMRIQLDEEIARAVLIGDGRDSSSDDKINEGNIRPIVSDDELYTLKYTMVVNNADDTAKNVKDFMRMIVKKRKEYKGSGTPILFTSEDILSDMLLLEDLNGRVIYDSMEKLYKYLRVSAIVTVPQFENWVYENSIAAAATFGDDYEEHKLMGIVVNLNDYNYGADKGGAVSMFDDFDIDFNQMKYLIETRGSGALVKPHAAQAFFMAEEST